MQHLAAHINTSHVRAPTASDMLCRRKNKLFESDDASSQRMRERERARERARDREMREREGGRGRGREREREGGREGARVGQLERPPY